MRNFVDEVWDRVVEMETVQLEIKHARRLSGQASVFADPQAALQTQADLAAAQAKQRANLKWCNDQLNNRRVEYLFREFLQIEH